MFEPKAVLKFGALLFASFALLMWSWPGWPSAYASYFRGFSNAAFTQYWFWPAGSVKFIDLRAGNVFETVDALVPVDLPEEHRKSEKFRPQGERDTLLLLQNRDVPNSFGLLRTGSRGIAYWPTATLIALVVATPLTLRKKFWLLLWSLIGIHVFILFRLTVYTAANGFFDADKKYALRLIGDRALGLWDRLETVFCDNPTVSFVAPVFIWLFVLYALRLWWTWRENLAAAFPAGGKRRMKRDEL